MLTEIINKLNSLEQAIRDGNKNVASINESILLFQNTLDKINITNWWDKYGSLIGVLIGSLITGLVSYFFTKKINKDVIIGRYAVQRKNLIYAKIFKELLDLQEYIKSNDNTYYLEIRKKEEDYEDYRFNGYKKLKGDFILWNKINKDIREFYIPNKIKILLKIINDDVDNYKKNQEKFKKDFGELYKNNSPFYGKRIKTNENTEQNVLLDNQQLIGALFNKGSDPLFFIDEIHKKWGKINELDNDKEVADFYELMKKEISFTDFYESYNLLLKSIATAKDEINKLITYIVQKYEYGSKLEKYDK